MSLNTPDDELVRVLSNPENLIVSEALLERLPAKHKEQNQKCKILVNEVEYLGNCTFLNFQKEKLQISLELDAEIEVFKFVQNNFPSEFFDTKVSISLLGEKEKTISGNLSEISCEPTPASNCIMSLVVYNYRLEDPHGT
tara:strand:+ start:248 stop:667 length:420 start_codon:yes stop_codon:yes gene_type:complete